MNQKSGPLAWLQYAALRSAIFILHLFPVNWNLQTAKWLGLIWWHSIPRHRDRAKTHLRLAYGHTLSAERINALALRSLQHLVMLTIDMIFTTRLITESTWSRYVKLRDLAETLRVLLEGRGAILLTGHYGNWELTGHLLAAYGFEIKAVMRPFDNVYLNRYVVRTRSAAGLELLDKKGAVRTAEEVLQRGGIVGFIADQNAGRKGLFVDFFGRQASTYKSIGLLAMTAEVPVIVGCARRLGDRLDYELCVERIIRPHEWQDQSDPLRWITQEYTSAIERMVRQDPAQYLWIHRRWKTRPKNETTPAPGSAAVVAR